MIKTPCCSRSKAEEGSWLRMLELGVTFPYLKQEKKLDIHAKLT